MPPADTKLSLSAEENELIRRWIEQGADWSEHWSFRPLRESMCRSRPRTGRAGLATRSTISSCSACNNTACSPHRRPTARR